MSLTPRQRSAFILFDGKRSMNDVIAAGLGVSREDIDQMLSLGLLAPADGHAMPPPLEPDASPGAGAATASAVPPGPSLTHQQRYQAAYPVATRLTAGLGLRGFKLNLAVEASTTWEELVGLAPKIRAAVGADRALELDRALGI